MPFVRHHDLDRRYERLELDVARNSLHAFENGRLDDREEAGGHVGQEVTEYALLIAMISKDIQLVG